VSRWSSCVCVCVRVCCWPSCVCVRVLLTQLCAHVRVSVRVCVWTCACACVQLLTRLREVLTRQHVRWQKGRCVPWHSLVASALRLCDVWPPDVCLNGGYLHPVLMPEGQVMHLSCCIAALTLCLLGKHTRTPNAASWVGAYACFELTMRGWFDLTQHVYQDSPANNCSGADFPQLCDHPADPGHCITHEERRHASGPHALAYCLLQLAK